MTPEYHPMDDFVGWDHAEEFLKTHIERFRPKVVFEIGSGANPTLSIENVGRYGLRYITSDRDPRELLKANPIYESRCLDLTVDSVPDDLVGRCDFVFSRMVNEHVCDGRAFHANIHKMLSAGGVAVHAFSTLYTLPFLANYLLPARLGDAALRFINPRGDPHKHGKFKAYYSWSRGPTRRSIGRFEKLGYDVIAYDGYFGHPYYRRFPLLNGLEALKTRTLLFFRVPDLCSYAAIVLQKAAS